VTKPGAEQSKKHAHQRPKQTKRNFKSGPKLTRRGNYLASLDLSAAATAGIYFKAFTYLLVFVIKYNFYSLNQGRPKGIAKI